MLISLEEPCLASVLAVLKTIQDLTLSQECIPEQQEYTRAIAMEGTKDRSAGLLDRTDDEARLQELDPSPVEESYEFIPDPNSEEAAKESPRPRQSGSVSSLLGLHEHSATWYCE